jgi:hypothetical protein
MLRIPDGFFMISSHPGRRVFPGIEHNHGSAMIRTLTRTALGGAAVAGALTFGAAGLAGAAGTTSPSTSATHTVNCTKAEARASRIGTREAKAMAWVTKAEARSATVSSAHHPRVAKRIASRLARVQKWEAHGEKRLARIAAACGSRAS